ncbi:DUF308 domain-containing protein, partial [Actinoplanes sp. NPDC048796]|uniref:DUF308 domain-containing protein n=1 Tax=Actinoplanes sp. NPDC048796 TaxID=3155640 RepID=UPI0033DEBC3A
MAATVRAAVVAEIRGVASLIAGEVQQARDAATKSESRHGAVVTGAIDAGPARLAATTRDGIDAVDKAAQTRTKEAEDVVAGAQTRARELGKSEGRRGKDAIDAQAAEASRRGQVKAATYPADERGDVQREAVLRVAAETAAKLAEPGPKLHSQLVESGEDLADGFDGAADSVIRTFASQAASIREALTTQGDALTPHLDLIATRALTGMADAGGQAEAGLAAVEQAVATELAGLEANLTGQLDMAIASTLEAIDVQTEAVIAALGSLISRCTDAVLQLDRPDLDRVRATVHATESMAGAVAQDLDEGLGDVALLVEETFVEEQDSVAAHCADIAAGATGGLATATGKIDEGFAVVASKATDSVDLLVKEWAVTLAESRTTADGAFGKAVEGLRTQVGGTLENGRLTLVGKVDEAVRKNREGLDGLETAMEKAAEEARKKYGAPWYKKLGSWLWNAFLGLLKALLTALAVILVAVIAIILIVAGIIEGTVALVIIGLVLLAAVVVFAVYGIVAGIVARVRSADTWYGGIWGFVVGVLDIVGLPNVIEGIIGRDIVNGRRLTVEDAGHRFGGGLFNLLTFILPMKFAKARGTPKLPPEHVIPPRAPEIPVIGEVPAGPADLPTPPAKPLPELPVEPVEVPEPPPEPVKVAEEPVKPPEEPAK